MIHGNMSADLKTDGRQSARALAIRRGVGRLLRNWNYTYVPELTLKSGRRVDMMALGPKGEIWIIEIKSSVADFLADKKWREYLIHCDRFFFATLPDVPPEIFPPETGLLIADDYGATIEREAPTEKIKAATRKALTLRFARHASANLHALSDPSRKERSVSG